MASYDGFKKNNSMIDGKGGRTFEENPLVQYEIQEPVERMVAAWGLLDIKAHDFLERFADDEVFDGILDVNEEWRCWLEGDKKNSCLFFDDTLVVFGDKAYDHFVDDYSAEWKDIAKQAAEIGKMDKCLDEYKLFKAALYNVFNNKNRLPIREYFDQVYSRAHDYNMELVRHSKNDMDLVVVFRPLDEVNRGNPYLNYKLHMEFNPTYGKDGFFYTAKMMEAYSADAMYSGPVDLPVLGQYVKFEERVNDHFLNADPSLFHFEAVRDKRVEEKAKYNIPAYYFEATYIDTSKLVDFSKKSYQYGHSSIFIPKSQVALGGDKLYVNRWLFYKLKEEVMALQTVQEDRAERTVKHSERKQSNSVDSVLKNAEERSAQRSDKLPDKSLNEPLLM